MKPIRLQDEAWETKRGGLTAIKYERNTRGHFKGWYADEVGNIYTHYLNDQEAKEHVRLINSLEPMSVIYVDIDPDFCGGIVVPRIPETIAMLEEFKARLFSGEWTLRGVVGAEELLKSIKWY